MIRIALREALSRHFQRTGEKVSYTVLSKRTGLSRATIESIATRCEYNTRLSTVEKLCRALRCQPGELLELTPPLENSSDED